MFPHRSRLNINTASNSFLYSPFPHNVIKKIYINRKKGRNRVRPTFLYNPKWSLRSQYTLKIIAAVDLCPPFSSVSELLQ